MLNTKTNRKNLYVELNKINLKVKFAKILGPRGTHYCRPEDGKIVPRLPSIATESPWVYVKTSGARCDVYHRVFFECLRYVHSYCRNCYKVVVAPRTLVELFDLYELQRELGVPCKCGIELRRTDIRLYGGYFYCRGVVEGRERYQEVRKLVNKHLSKSTPVILKRYCTEFEIGPDGKGPSDKMPECTEEELKFEEFAMRHLPRVTYETPMPDHLTAAVMVDWIHHAYMHGDPTYKEFTGGTPLFKPVVTYHQSKEK